MSRQWGGWRRRVAGVAVPGWLGLRGLREVRLPVEGRDASRVAGRLEPVAGDGFYAWLVCGPGPGCRVCIVFGGGYRVEWRRVRVKDPLSGLVLRLPALRGVMGGLVVWEAAWRGGMLRVDRIACDAAVTPEGRVMCSAGFECWGRECLEECRRATLGP